MACPAYFAPSFSVELLPSYLIQLISIGSRFWLNRLPFCYVHLLVILHCNFSLALLASCLLTSGTKLVGPCCWLGSVDLVLLLRPALALALRALHSAPALAIVLAR